MGIKKVVVTMYNLETVMIFHEHPDPTYVQRRKTIGESDLQ
jgi:hypothetical protein